MDKNLIWKTVVIALIVIVSAVISGRRRKSSNRVLDLAGGTSLVYEIDTADLSPNEQKDLAQNMIPILLKRIDPTHVPISLCGPQG
jgi:preprotein translocase subunit SecD